MSQKVLFVYYSLTGNVDFIAKEFKNKTNCDLFRIEPVSEPNKNSGLKYLWGGYQVLMKKLPKLKEANVPWENYDTIIIGAPVWAWTFAPPIRTFLTSNKITNKKIALICTHEGGIGKTFSKMKELLQGNEVIFEQDFFKPLKEREKTTQKIEDIANAF